MSAKAALIEFLASSRIDSRDGGVWDDGAIVAFFATGTSTPKAVWTDRDKTLPTAAGITQTTLGTDGSVSVFGDGIYDVKIYDSTDSGLTTPLKTFTGINSADGTVGAELTDPVFIDGTDSTKKVSHIISGVSTGTTREATWPDKSGTVAMTSDIISYGTWTPALWDDTKSSTEGQTYSNQTGRYAKVGKLVFFDLWVAMTGLGTLTTTQFAQISLPLQAGAGFAVAGAIGQFGAFALDVNDDNLTWTIASSGTSLTLFKRDDSASPDSSVGLKISELTASGFVFISGVYTAA